MPDIRVLTEVGGDVDVIYEHNVKFDESVDGATLTRRLRSEANKSRAEVLVIDIEKYRWVDQNLDTVREITRQLKRPGRVVAWYTWPDDGGLRHDYEGVDAIYVPGHSNRTRDVAVPRAVELAVKHRKLLIVQYSHRIFDRKSRLITPTELRAHTERFKQIHSELVRRGAPGLMLSIWSSDHTSSARTEGGNHYRPEPRWTTDQVIEFAEHVEDLLNERQAPQKLGAVVTSALVSGEFADGQANNDRLVEVCRSYLLRGRPVSVVPTATLTIEELDERIQGEASP